MKFFETNEFDCSHTGENRMNEDFLSRLDNLRAHCGFPFIITSGYRDPTHPVEASKMDPGTHAQGIAADILVSNGIERRAIAKNAFLIGFNGIGIADDFVHVDTRQTTPVMWCY